MKRIKALGIIAILLVGLLGLSSCQESTEAKYNRANKLLTEGKYTEAAAVFDEISTYEDSSKMSMYAKAISAAESGDYQTGISSFQTLGDYKDSQLMVAYYTAREYESKSETSDKGMNLASAAKTYQKLGLFRDSKERCDDCFERAYIEAGEQAGKGEYSTAIAIYSGIPEYKDSSVLATKAEADSIYDSGDWAAAHEIYMTLDEPYRTHAADYQASFDSAVKARADGKYDEARETFWKLGNYNNSLTEIRATYYAEGEALREAKDWGGARKAFGYAGNYQDAADQIKETTYQEAVYMESNGDLVGAADKFMSVKGYKDAQDRALKLYYEHGVSRREAKDWNGARAAFEKAGTYSDAETQIKETTYQEASDLEAIGDQEGAYNLFISLGDYSNSYERANKPYYDLGVQKREAGEWDAAVTAFKHAGTYSDAAEQVSATRYAEGEARRREGDWDGAANAFYFAGEYLDAPEQIKATRYLEGEAKRSANDWDGARKAFGYAADYLDAAEQILATWYAEGEAKRAVGDWDGARDAFENAGKYGDAKTQIKETTYQEAASFYAKGQYQEAYGLYKDIKGYKDVDSLLEKDENLAAVRKASFKAAGNVVTFGHYEQDNNTGNGPEEIEWIVLDVQDGKALLISKYGLDTRPYNTERVNTTWETCTLRAWLNNEFLNKAFSPEEHAAILTTEVDNSSAQGCSEWNTDGGNNTQDKVFLLSYAEAHRYFGVEHQSVTGSGQNTAARIAPTEFAIQAGAYTRSDCQTADGKPAGWWWLRSPGRRQDGAADVGNDGSLYNGSLVNSDSGVVRPAFWVNLESDYFNP